MLVIVPVTPDVENDIELDEIPDDTPIDNEMYLASPKVYKYAMDMTEKELMQAVQGMYHNLNTLQSR